MSMLNKSEKTEIAKAKVAQQIAKYSTDYDKTIVIQWIFRLFFLMMVSLVVLEGVARFVFGIEGAYLTAEIVHTIFGFIGGWASAVVTNFFAEQIAKRIEGIPKNKMEDKQ